MNFAKEKKRLESLLFILLKIEHYSEDNFEIINNAYREYADILKTLHTKEANLFGNLYNYDLKEIKNAKKLVKASLTDEVINVNFIVYKNTIVYSSERTIEYMDLYFQ